METESKRLAALAASQTLAMAQKSRELKSKGVDVINLSVGEPDFHTPDHVKEAAKKAIDDNFSFYTPVSGFDDLTKAIVNKLKRDNNLDYNQKQIVVSCGAKQSITNVFLSVLNPGDEVLIPTPYWVSYPEAIKLAESKPVYLRTTIEDDFKITAEELSKAISRRTRMFVFSSPSNPAGTVYSKAELKAIAEVLAKNPQILILSDEIYEYINFSGKHESIAQFPEVKNQTIIVNGVSKGYAMTGWRIGYIAAPEWIAKACDKLQGQYTSGACSIAQKASVAAINGSLEYPEMMCKAFLRRRDLVYDGLSKIKGLKLNKPEGAFYMFTNISAFLDKKIDGLEIKNANDLSLYLLEKAHVATVGGEGFGHPDCLRISFAASDEMLVKAIERITKALEYLM
ncbi:MAG: pyridoxal phosphate-dependent aminotransferase [Bacteroidales bacterium]|nr:pyridoxal phosphate-dependent aminotransferase [Bacteroidales bacterium]